MVTVTDAEQSESTTSLDNPTSNNIRINRNHVLVSPQAAGVGVYTGAALKCPVLGLFRVTIAELGWTRQNGPAIFRHHAVP
jgi:hypothetical protein